MASPSPSPSPSLLPAPLESSASASASASAPAPAPASALGRPAATRMLSFALPFLGLLPAFTLSSCSKPTGAAEAAEGDDAEEDEEAE